MFVVNRLGTGKTIIIKILKTVVLYESYFGNTWQIAGAIGNSLTPNNEVRVLNVSEVSWNEISYAEGPGCWFGHTCFSSMRSHKTISENCKIRVKSSSFFNLYLDQFYQIQDKLYICNSFKNNKILWQQKIFLFQRNKLKK